MYKSTRHENESSLNFKLPWDKNTARGFGIAVLTTFFTIFIADYFNLIDNEVHVRTIEIRSIPIELLNWGDGDGTGMSAGNLQDEGKRHKGNEPNSVLEDAKIAAKTKRSNTSSNTDIDRATDFKPVSELSSNENSESSEKGESTSNIGSKDGDPNGTGLKDKGFGKGAGNGFGDIEWGGGGNRTVLTKIVPKMPPGVNRTASIKIKFWVQPDGTIRKMIPLKKADPRIEKAAMDALRRWRFNKLDDNREMVGIIPLTFRLR